MAITTANIYVSPSSQDPSGTGGFTGAGSLWSQSDTGIWLVRNSTSTGWVTIGSGDQPSFGLMPASGGAMSGSVSGTTNLMTADGNTPFAIPPTITSKSSLLASMLDLSNLQTTMTTLIQQIVTQAIAGIYIPSINTSLSFATTRVSGQITPTPAYNTTMTLPWQTMVYGDGTSVQQSECHGFACVEAFPGGNGVTYLVPQDSQGLSWQCYQSTTAVPFNYFIIAVKSTA